MNLEDYKRLVTAYGASVDSDGDDLLSGAVGVDKPELAARIQGIPSVEQMRAAAELHLSKHLGLPESVHAGELHLTGGHRDVPEKKGLVKKAKHSVLFKHSIFYCQFAAPILVGDDPEKFGDVWIEGEGSKWSCRSMSWTLAAVEAEVAKRKQVHLVLTLPNRAAADAVLDSVALNVALPPVHELRLVRAIMWDDDAWDYFNSAMTMTALRSGVTTGPESLRYVVRPEAEEAERLHNDLWKYVYSPVGEGAP